MCLQNQFTSAVILLAAICLMGATPADPSDSDGKWSAVQHSISNQIRQESAATDICNSRCKCTRENKLFLHVECDFSEDNAHVLDGLDSIPEDAITMRIKLAPHAQLQLNRNLFQNNKLNRISIEGHQLQNQQVELNPFAFHNNKAPFPEIEIKNVHKLHIYGNAFNGEFKLNVINCVDVIVSGNAFNSTAFHGFFEKIKDLRFETNAFYGTKHSKIEIVASNVGLLERMDAAMREVKIVDSKIDAIKSNTFNVLSISSILFINCDIGVIEANATTEKLFSNYFGLLGCRIGVIQSGAILDSGIAEVALENNQIETIEPNGISVSSISVSVAHNSITKAAHHWISVKQWSNITIFNNSFGHFDAMGIKKEVNPVQCSFQRNSITKPEPNSLDIDNKFCSIKETIFFQLCSCKLEDWLSQISPRDDLKHTSYCQIDSALKHCFNSTTFNVQNYFREVCNDRNTVLDCGKNREEKKVDAKFIDPDDMSSKSYFKRNLPYILGSGGLVLILVVVVLVIYCRYKYQKSRHNNTISSRTNVETQGTINSNKDNRSFSVDDRHVIRQALERLRATQPEEVYSHIVNNTTKLLNENLSETEKVLTIGEIVRVLDECDNIGDAFVAFTDILYRHLDDNHNPDPVYAEPNTAPTAATVIHPSQNAEQMQQTALDADHIYAEPHSAQQPLLTNEYSLPVDRHDQGNLYSEPVLAQKDEKKWITPYAIGMHLPPVPNQNLPDVLAQSSPSTSSATTTHPLNQHRREDHPLTTSSALPMYSIPFKNTTFSPSGAAGPSTGKTTTTFSPTALSKTATTTTTKPSTTTIPEKQPNSSACSSHSGGSDITVKLDDIGQYVDT